MKLSEFVDFLANLNVRGDPDVMFLTLPGHKEIDFTRAVTAGVTNNKAFERGTLMTVEEAFPHSLLMFYFDERN